MTYPVDDAGNPRVDFVWGNMAMQPNDQRDVVTAGPEPLYPANGEGNFGWDATFIYPSEGLYSSVTQTLSIGDKDGFTGAWDEVATRTVSVPADNHSVALTGYNNYPQFIADYAGDGDVGLESVVPDLASFAVSAMDDAVVAAGLVYASTTTYVGATTVNDGKIKTQSPAAGVKANIGATVTATFYNAPEVPNVVGLTESAANTALINAHVVKGAVTTANNAAGATAINDGLVKTQTPAAGTTVNTGASVALVKYAYVAPIVSTTGPIAGFNRGTPFSPLGADQTPMYLVGRTVFPAIGDTITITGASDSQFNRDWYVENVIDNDGYNTGGTAVLLTKVGATAFTGTTATGGTWTKQ